MLLRFIYLFGDVLLSVVSCSDAELFLRTMYSFRSTGEALVVPLVSIGDDFAHRYSKRSTSPDIANREEPDYGAVESRLYLYRSDTRRCRLTEHGSSRQSLFNRPTSASSCTDPPGALRGPLRGASK